MIDDEETMDIQEIIDGMCEEILLLKARDRAHSDLIRRLTDSIQSLADGHAKTAEILCFLLRRSGVEC